MLLLDRWYRFPSPKQVGTEIRYIRIALSNRERLLSNVFTIRDESIRIISSRPANAKEQKSIEKPLVRKKTSRKREIFAIPRLPEYEADMSHLMTKENRRPEVEELIKKMVGNKVVNRKMKS